ncbi:MAG: transcription-repair coupling factor, partial [Planctomycetaceae bacterium]|nr:transcription-repair coupling factor [Planctomycetaceae bacterium]
MSTREGVLNGNVTRISDLVPLMEQEPGLAQLLGALNQGRSGTIDGAWGSARALSAAVFVRNCPGIAVVIAPRASDVDDYAVDLREFLDVEPALFPVIDGSLRQWSPSDPAYAQRMMLLKSLSPENTGARPNCIVTSIEALMQPVPSAAQMREVTRRIAVGQTLDLEEFSGWLVSCGFERTTAIELPGEFAVHGGIVDIYSTDSPAPYRIEMFDDEIESIRTIDVASQRKIEQLNEINLTLFALNSDSSVKGRCQPEKEFTQHLSSFLAEDSWFILSELQELLDEGKLYLDRLDHREGLFHPRGALEACTQFPSVSISAISAGSFEESCDLRSESIERFAFGDADPLQELASSLGKEESVLLCCLNEGEQSRLTELIQEKHPELVGRARLCIGRCSKGFRLVSQRLLVVSDHELYGRRDVRPNRKKRTLQTRAIDSFLELSEGDLVVHIGHGVGKYRGMKVVETEQHAQEHLIVEFADQVRIFVPVSLIHLVQKYVG